MPEVEPVCACDVCGETMRPDIIEDTFSCPHCGFLRSTFAVRIGELDRIDEATRERALKPIRTANFAQLLDGCAYLLSPGACLLDVGCAHGWFLEAATARGFRASGIEPDEQMVARATAAGHPVTTGYFPDALSPGATYDVITFHDVFEHIPHVLAVACAVHERLNPGGLVIINLPVSDGMIFRTTRLAARLGLRGPLERMWQKGLPSPHLSYFSAATLPRLMTRTGFQLVHHAELESIHTDGLFGRIRYDRSVRWPQAALMYLGARLLKVAERLTASDIQYFVFRKVGP